MRILVNNPRVSPPTKSPFYTQLQNASDIILEKKRRAAAKMGVFTFVCKGSGDEWSAKQYKGDLEASASCTYDLQRKLVQAALASDSSGGVQSSFSYITPSSAVFQVNNFMGPFCLLFLSIFWIWVF